MKVFYDAYGGKDKLLGLTTTDVNEKYQKPITATSQLSYCEYLKLQNSPFVGQAVVFISHGIIIIIITTTTHSYYHCYNHDPNHTYAITTTTVSMEVPVIGCN